MLVFIVKSMVQFYVIFFNPRIASLKFVFDWMILCFIGWLGFWNWEGVTRYMIQRKTRSDWLKICLECINLKIAVSLHLSFEKEYLVKIFLSS